MSTRLKVATTLAAFLAGVGAAPPGGWIADGSAGCQIWNPHPQPAKRSDGRAPAPTVMRMASAPRNGSRTPAIETDEGEWRAGRQTGYGTQALPSGPFPPARLFRSVRAANAGEAVQEGATPRQTHLTHAGPV